MRRATASRASRFSLRLFEANERECPEFDYRELVTADETRRRAERDERRRDAQWDAFSDNDEDVERIAKQFEQKYGGSSVYGRSKGRTKQDDYADIGAGYDENDSFIDNTDGYDEIIPPECDTACGGFYINSGSLEFKNVSGAGLSTGEGAAGDSSPPIHKKPHKRILSSSESEEVSSSVDEDSDTSLVEKTHPTDENTVKTSVKFTEDSKKHKLIKTKYLDSKESYPRKKRKSSQEGSASSGQETNNDKKTSKDVIHSIINEVENNPEGSSDSHSSDSSKPQVVPSSDNPASSDSSRDNAHIKSTTSLVSQLSLSDLSPEFSSLLHRLKLLADTHFSSHSGKLSGSEVDEIILRLEMQCKHEKISTRIRHNIYGYTAQVLRRGKAGLLQRVRRLIEDHQQTTEIQTPLEKLNGLIEDMRPALLEQYKMEAQKIMDINKQIATQNANLDDEKKIQERRLPKRKFPWNDQVRAALQDVLHSRGMNITDNLDEGTVKFLQTDILPLFPPGFVRMPTLLQQVKNPRFQKPSSDVKRKPLDSKQKVTFLGNTSHKSKDTVDKCKSISVEIENKDCSKNQDMLISCLKNNRVLSVAIERIPVNANEVDKNEEPKELTNTNFKDAVNVLTFTDDVMPKSSDSEKIESVIIKTCSTVQKDVDVSIGTGGSDTVIKSVESICGTIENESPNIGSIKPKPLSSLFDKNAIIKMSDRNSNIDILKEQSNENLKPIVTKVKNGDKIFNKPYIQDCSHLIKRKGNNHPIQPNNSTNHKYEFNVNHQSNQSSNTLICVETNASSNIIKDLNTITSHSNEQTHKFIKPSSRVVDLSQVQSSLPSNKVHQNFKRADSDTCYEKEVDKFNGKIKKPNTIEGSGLSVLNVDDSSSDDCVEIFTDEQVFKQNKKITDISQYENKKTFKRRMISEYEKYLHDKDFEITPDYCKNTSDKWVHSARKDTPQSSFNKHEFRESNIIKKTYNIGTEYKPKKVVEIVNSNKTCDKVESTRISENVNSSLNKNQTVSVIKDVINVNNEEVCENLTFMLNENDGREKETVMSQEFNTVMQNLKELQVLQMSGSRQEHYSDPGVS